MIRVSRWRTKMSLLRVRTCNVCQLSAGKHHTLCINSARWYERSDWKRGRDAFYRTFSRYNMGMDKPFSRALALERNHRCLLGGKLSRAYVRGWRYADVMALGLGL